MKRWLLALVASIISFSISARELHLPQPPAGLELYWVARYMEFNDLPMSIQSFKTFESTSNLTPRLMTYLEKLGGAVHVTTDQDGWMTLATADDEYFYSIRFFEHPTEIEGVFTVSARTPNASSSPRLPLGFVRIEKQTFFDGPSIQEFTVLSSNSGQSEALAIVERMMRQDGWNTTRNYQSTRYFSRGNALAHATARTGENGVGTLILISKELDK